MIDKSIDPIAAAQIEDLIISLRGKLAIIVSTHSMMEARRVLEQDIVSIEHVRVAGDVPDQNGGLPNRLAIRYQGTADKLVAVWQLSTV